MVTDNFVSQLKRLALESYVMVCKGSLIFGFVFFLFVLEGFCLVKLILFTIWGGVVAGYKRRLSGRVLDYARYERKVLLKLLCVNQSVRSLLLFSSSSDRPYCFIKMRKRLTHAIKRTPSYFTVCVSVFQSIYETNYTDPAPSGSFFVVFLIVKFSITACTSSSSSHHLPRTTFLSFNTCSTT